MKLINTDGMALIGPGSEWLWTALSGLVLAITFIAIWRQLRLQRSAASIEQVRSFDREFGSELLARCRLEVLLAVAEGRAPGDLPPSVNKILTFYETVGSLLRRGHLDRDLMYGFFSYNVQHWWGWLAPRVAYDREIGRDPKMWEDFEWLAGWFRERARKAGDIIVDDETRTASLPSFIAGSRSTVRLAEELRGASIRPLRATPGPSQDSGAEPIGTPPLVGA